MYDPMLGRFRATDPAGQQYSPYAYAGNNPVSMVDPDGEFFVEALVVATIAISAGKRGYRAYQESGGDWLYTLINGFMGGAKSAAYSYATVYAPTGGVHTKAGYQVLRDPTVAKALANGLKQHGPRYTVDAKHASLSIGPSVAAGTDGYRLATDVSGSVKLSDDMSLSASGSLGGTRSHSLEYESLESRFSIGGSFRGTSLHFTRFGGPRSQWTGSLAFSRWKDGYLRTDNDFFAKWADSFEGEDRFRTAALEVGYSDFGAGFQVITGDGEETVPGTDPAIADEAVPYRAGPVYLRIQRGSNEYRFGANSEYMRAAIQNNFHHFINSLGRHPILQYPFLFGGDALNFEEQKGRGVHPWFSVGTDDPYSIY